jgi:hypothetical protein
MTGPRPIRNRLVLVPRELPRDPAPGRPRVRRYSLARLAPSPYSALGEDRHERLERVAEMTPPDGGCGSSQMTAGGGGRGSSRITPADGDAGSKGRAPDSEAA